MFYSKKKKNILKKLKHYMLHISAVKRVLRARGLLDKNKSNELMGLLVRFNL